MKKSCLLFLSIFFFLFLSEGIAQVSVNPTDDFYIDALGWYSKGYIDYLPQMKPYSPAIIEEILLSVANTEDVKDKQRAQDYYSRYFGRKIHVDLSGNFRASIYTKEDAEEDDNIGYYDSDRELYSGKLSVGGDIGINPYFGIGYDFGVRGFNDDVNVNEVFAVNSSETEYQKIEHLSFNRKSIDWLLDLNTVVSFGNRHVYGAVGFNRIGYGIFPDSDLIFNPKSFQIANANVNFVLKGFEYTQLFGVPVAQSKDYSDDYKWCKLLSFHSLKVPLFNNKFSVSYYESAIYGNYFNPSYFLPAPWALISRISGFSENVLAGFKLQANLFPCFSISADFMMNDIDLKPFIKLKWNDAAIRGAIKTGFVYTPTDSSFRYIKMDYTLVTPYTYTSYDTRDKTYNYTDYTNYGKSIGSELLPNSHQLEVAFQFTPIKRFSVTSTTKFSQHANQYENLSDDEIVALSSEFISDGSLKQTVNKFDSAIEETGFMNQDHRMTVINTAIDIDYELRNTKSMSICLNVGYSFEYKINDGIDNSIFPGKYQNIAEVKAARSSWESQLHNSQNHYFRAGVTFKY